MKRSGVRDTTLECTKCERWLPDEEFNRAAAIVVRRGRRYACKECRAAWYSARNPKPTGFVIANAEWSLGIVTRTPDQMGRDQDGRPRVPIFTPWPSKTPV